MTEVWREGATGEPKFPATFDVLKKAVLQVTDIKTNRNKYYCVELHSGGKKFRVYTHYGRTDDLDSNPDAGVKESRYFDSSAEADVAYAKIYKEKTSKTKGYREVSLASSKIGSHQSRGKSSGEIDDKTLAKLAKVKDKAVAAPTVTISQEIQSLVATLYKEATNALVSTVNVAITANGIETPLGVLTIGQIDKGQAILDQIATTFQKKKKDQDLLQDLSGQFFTAIPHKFGRSREAALLAVIDSANKINEKQDTLQLMRDMLNVNGKTNVLANSDIVKKYQALKCEISHLAPSSAEYKKIAKYIVQNDGKYLKIKNIFQINRPEESAEFNTQVGNERQLFHGSAARNWVGILSRGLLLPKIVVTLGVTRTDGGWLGDGIYFGSEVDTAHNYAGYGSGSRYITVAEVALGKIKEYKKITYGLKSPPAGFDSCHGNPSGNSEFSDNEFVVYKHNQQRLQYLVEC